MFGIDPPRTAVVLIEFQNEFTVGNNMCFIMKYGVVNHERIRQMVENFIQLSKQL
jgi:hypothetical protein